jgi:hypothetical protein
MKSFRESLVLVSVLLATQSCESAREEFGGPRGEAVQPPSNEWGIEVGDNLPACREKIKWKEVSPEGILSQNPFVRTLCFLKPETTILWTDGLTNSSGWPTFLIGVVSTPTRGSLVDLFEVRGGLFRPLVRGQYEKALRSIEPGWKVAEMYRVVGRQMCDYYLHSSGGWQVHFLYYGFRGAFIAIDADAATGVVVRVRDATI